MCIQKCKRSAVQNQGVVTIGFDDQKRMSVKKFYCIIVDIIFHSQHGQKMNMYSHFIFQNVEIVEILT